MLWFCCLPAYELSVTRGLLAAFAFTLGFPIPASIYDALWAGPAPSKAGRKEAYYWYFALGREWIINPVTEEPEEVVFILNLSFWLELSEYAATPAAECLDGCGRRDFS
jgi:hypothetical protein